MGTRFLASFIDSQDKYVLLGFVVNVDVTAVYSHMCEICLSFFLFIQHGEVQRH